MSIQPEGEQLRNAVKWISEQRKDGKGVKDGGSDSQLVSQAALKFNLSPKEEEYLHRFLKEGRAS
jgi:hypothetical protein